MSVNVWERPVAVRMRAREEEEEDVEEVWVGCESECELYACPKWIPS